jgi:serine acetyltransferase
MQEPFFGALDGHRPQIAENAFIAPATVVVGKVRIGARSSVWYGSVLRGDDEEIFTDPGYPAVREVRDSDREMIRHSFESYVRKSDVHRGTEPLSAREVRG